MISSRVLSENIEEASVGGNGPDVGFVACIEAGVLERQALLLFELLDLLWRPVEILGIY